jgi:hypothetical protein
MKLLFILVFVVSLSGCAAFTSPKEKPVIEELGRFCAEPSPDVAESISSSLRAAATASVAQGNTATAAAAITAAKDLSTSLSTLFIRTQGVQFMRDALYALCQDKMNGVYGSVPNNTSPNVGSAPQIDASDMNEYRKARDQVIKLAYLLIDRELELVEKRKFDAAMRELKDVQTEARKFADVAKQAAESAMEERKKAEQAAEAAKTAKK